MLCVRAEEDDNTDEITEEMPEEDHKETESPSDEEENSEKQEPAEEMPEEHETLYGLQLIDNEWYYFDELTGEMVTGFVYLEDLCMKVYFDPESGAMVYGMQTINDEQYYFDPVTGEMAEGFKYFEEEDITRYFEADSGIMCRGICEAEGYTYYFDEDTGAMLSGFVSIADPQGTVYLDPETGHMLYGQQYIDGFWYYFDEDTGNMATGFVYVPQQKKVVYFDEDGHMLYGKQEIEDTVYYFNQDTGALSSGVTHEGGSVYYYDSQTCERLTGQIFDGRYWYYFDEQTGEMVTGFKYVTSQKKTVYYDPVTGRMATGEVYIEGERYFFDDISGGLVDNVFRLVDDEAGNVIQVFIKNGRIVKTSFRYGLRFYHVDPQTGEIYRTQELFSESIYLSGIDISSHNGEIDLEEYEDGFVIIRAAWGTNADTLALRNMNLCEKLKIPYGVYVYSYAVNDEQVLSEADYVLAIIKGRDIKLGVWFDIEDDNYKRNRIPDWPNASVISRHCRLFCSKIEEAGYTTGIYTSYSWFKAFINNPDQYPKWIAHWGSNDGSWNIDLSGQCEIHQFTSVPLDRNVLYVDPSLLSGK